VRHSGGERRSGPRVELKLSSSIGTVKAVWISSQKSAGAATVSVMSQQVHIYSMTIIMSLKRADTAAGHDEVKCMKCLEQVNGGQV